MHHLQDFKFGKQDKVLLSSDCMLVCCMILMLMLWVLADCSLDPLWVSRKIKIDCSWTLCAGQTHGRTDRHYDILSSCWSKKVYISQGGRTDLSVTSYFRLVRKGLKVLLSVMLYLFYETNERVNEYENMTLFVPWVKIFVLHEGCGRLPTQQTAH